MENWQPIETAPQDGTWIHAKDASGKEATIQFRHPAPEAPDWGMWFEGEVDQQGSWESHKCFYPTHWNPESTSDIGDNA